MEKLLSLKERIKSLNRVAVAFSGGADSLLLLKTATDELGKENAFGVFVDTAFVCNSEREAVKQYSEMFNIVILPQNIFQEEITANKEDRCCHCKRLMMGKIKEFASENNISTVIDGANCDDLKTFRTGMAECDSLGVSHPLIECGIFKEDIKKLLLQSGLSNFGRSHSCYATHIETGQSITEEKIQKIITAEKVLLDNDLKSAKVKLCGRTLKIQILRSDYDKLCVTALDQINQTLSTLAEYVNLDIITAE